MMSNNNLNGGDCSCVSTLIALQDRFLFLCDTVKAATCSALLSDSRAITLDQASAQICDVYTHAGLDDLVENIEAAGELSKALLLVRSELPPCRDGLKKLYEILKTAKVGAKASDDETDKNSKIGDHSSNSKQWMLAKTFLALSEGEVKSNNIFCALANLRFGIHLCREQIQKTPERAWTGCLAEFLERMGGLWSRLGDKRRAKGYSLAANDCLGLGLEPKSTDLIHSTFEMRSSRLNHNLLMLELPPEEIVVSESRDDMLSYVESSHVDVERIVEFSLSLISQGDVLRRISQGKNNGFVEYYLRSKKILEPMIGREFGALVEKLVGFAGEEGNVGVGVGVGVGVEDEKVENRFGQIMTSILVRIARSKELIGSPKEVNAVGLYEYVQNCAFATPEDRARSCYRLGRLKLAEEKAAGGGLDRLWSNENDNDNDGEQCAESRILFLAASRYCGSGTTKLARQIFRCLALTAGKRGFFEKGCVGTIEAVMNIHKSVGGTSRVFVAHGLETNSEEGGGGIRVAATLLNLGRER